MKSNETRIKWNLFFIQNYQIFSIIRYFHWFTLSSYDYSYSYYFISQTALVLCLYPSQRTCAYNFKFFIIIFLFFSLAIPIQSDCRYHLAFVKSPSLLLFCSFYVIVFHFFNKISLSNDNYICNLWGWCSTKDSTTIRISPELHWLIRWFWNNFCICPKLNSR